MSHRRISRGARQHLLALCERAENTMFVVTSPTPSPELKELALSLAMGLGPAFVAPPGVQLIRIVSRGHGMLWKREEARAAAAIDAAIVGHGMLQRGKR